MRQELVIVDIATITTGLTRDSRGIWGTDEHADLSYPESGHAACLAVEESSFWFNHRNECIAALVGTHPPGEGATIFDVGGGNGYVSLGLEAAGFDVVLVEPGRNGAQNAKARGVSEVICATTSAAGFTSGSVGAVGMFDVIEHLPDDVAFVREVAEPMPAGGRAYATVPAYQALWSGEDIRAGHHRRYTADQIARVFDDAGFDVDYVSYFFRPLPLPVALTRALPHRLRGRPEPSERASTGRDHGTDQGPLTALMRRMLAPEVAHIRNGRTMRFGGSILVAATKR